MGGRLVRYSLKAVHLTVAMLTNILCCVGALPERFAVGGCLRSSCKKGGHSRGLAPKRV